MKKSLKEVLLSLFSGTAGIIITISYQHFFDPPQSFTFVNNGNEVVVTESKYLDIVEENSQLKNSLNSIQDELNNLKLEVNENNSSKAIKNIIDNASKYWNDSNYIQALTVLKTSNIESEEIKLIYKQYLDEYCSILIKQSETLVAEKKYDEAIALLTDSIKMFPNNQILFNQLESTKKNLPKNLSEIVLVDSLKYEYNEDLFSDSYGNHYTGSHKFYCEYCEHQEDEPYAIYNIDKKYNTFSAKIVASPDTAGDLIFIVQIFADEKLIYVKEDFDKRTNAVDLDLDISNASILKIKVSVSDDSFADSYGAGSGYCIYFTDANIS